VATAADHEPSFSSDVETVWRFAGSPGEFWSKFLAAAAPLVKGKAAMMMVRDRQDAATWKKIAPWPTAQDVQPLVEVESSLAESCLLNGYAWCSLSRNTSSPEPRAALAITLKSIEKQDDCIAVFMVPAASDEIYSDSIRALGILVHAPIAYQERQMLQQSRSDVGRFSSVLDLLTAVALEKKFVAMAMTCCNEIAARHRCDKVSLGWLEPDGYVHLQAISHTERFERKMDVVKKIEYAMEEAIDQDDELVWPAPKEAVTVSREHESNATSRGIAYICTLPLRITGKPVAAISCERQSAPFDEAELRLMRLSCDMVTPRLVDLKRRDRWIGARLREWVRESASQLVGVEHTWAKVTGIFVALLLGILIFGRMPYRVEGNFILRAEDAMVIPAMLDGYISQVAVEVGDRVAQSQDLLMLDNRELLLEEASAVADHQRYVREAEKSRAENKLADMQIALALSDQAKARLELIRQRLSRSRIQAPFDGIVVEGDLRERVGAPVRLGDPLFRIARMENLYVRMEVGEAQIHEVESGMGGRIAFVSQPQLKFPVRVTRVDPVAVGKDGKNIFTLRCEVVGTPGEWWRPGMSGIGKVEVGRRSILWIFTRRTMDFLRLKLWW